MNLAVYLTLAGMLLIAALIVLRFFVRRDYRRIGRLTPLSSALETLVFFLWGAFTWLDLPPGWPPSDSSPILRLIAWALVFIGLAALFLLVAGFGLRRSLGQEVNGLRQSGVYRLSRNPQTVSCIVAVSGYALLWPSWHTLGWVVLLVALVHMLVLVEEEHLLERYGHEYLLYKARVPRYLGWPGKGGRG